jgi:hypothetical protein
VCKEQLEELVKVAEYSAVSFTLLNEVRRLSQGLAVGTFLRKYIFVNCYKKQINNFNGSINKYCLEKAYYRSDSFLNDVLETVSFRGVV